MEGHESSSARGHAEMSMIADHFHIPYDITDTAFRLYKLALQHGFTRGRRVNQVGVTERVQGALGKIGCYSVLAVHLRGAVQPGAAARFHARPQGQPGGWRGGEKAWGRSCGNVYVPLLVQAGAAAWLHAWPQGHSGGGGRYQLCLRY